MAVLCCAVVLCRFQHATHRREVVIQVCCHVQSRALLYLFTLTHSVMEAMAAAEQAIELATATTSMATATRTAAAAATNATKPSTIVLPSQKAASSNSTAGDRSLPQSTVKETHHGGDGAQHAQHGHMDPLQEALQLQHHSQTLLEEEGQEDDSRPLIAGPKGLLQVSLDQRPAKQYFDRLAVPPLPTNFHPCCACCAGFQAI